MEKQATRQFPPKGDILINLRLWREDFVHQDRSGAYCPAAAADYPQPATRGAD
jgi:hypothetical protein